MTKQEIRLSVLKSIEAYCIGEKVKLLNMLVDSSVSFDRIKNECVEEWVAEWKRHQNNFSEAIANIEREEEHPYIQSAEEFEKTGDLQITTRAGESVKVIGHGDIQELIDYINDVGHL